MGVQSGVRSGAVGRGSTNVNQELKVLLKEHKGILQLITVKKYENGGPHRVIENERKLKKRGKNCVPLSGFEPRSLRVEVLHLTTRLKLQNGILQNIQTEITRKKIIIFLFSSGIGHFLSIKADVLQTFSFITGDKTECLSPMMFSNYYITGI